jgi:uncharacterized caspase-like protein
MDFQQENNELKPLLLGRSMRWALLVGVGEYEDVQSFGQLKACIQDATQLRRQLIIGGFPEQHIKLLTDDTAKLPLREDILEALQSTADVTEPDDLLLFYFSGHGEIKGGESYLIPRNGKGANLLDTAIAIKRVKEIVIGARARAKVIILDTCHSGVDIGIRGNQPMTPEFIQYAFADAEGLAILSSCTAGQLSYNWPGKEYGVFTYYLLEALQGRADSDNKGFVTVMDVNRYVTYQVKVWAFQQHKRQQPTLHYEVIGDIVLLEYQAQNLVQPVSASSEELDPLSKELLTSYFGDLQALREKRLPQRLIEQLTKDEGIIPRDTPLKSPEDLLERYNRVPLHAILLYTSEDKEILTYLKEHFAVLQALLADICDVHLIADQFSTPQNYNAYTMMNKLQMVKPSDLPPYADLPALLFWDHYGANTYISLASRSEATAIREAFRTISDEIHREPTIDAVLGAKVKLSRQESRAVEEKSDRRLHVNDTFNHSYDVLARYIDDLELQEICRVLGINYQSLDDKNHATRAFSLTRKMENQMRLDELEGELRRRQPRRFTNP